MGDVVEEPDGDAALHRREERREDEPARARLEADVVHGEVAHTGSDPRPETVNGAGVRAWFCPEHGEALSHRVAKHIGKARKRIRIASPVLTSGPILATLVEVVNEQRCDLGGIVDDTQVDQVFHQWRTNGVSEYAYAISGERTTAMTFSWRVQESSVQFVEPVSTASPSRTTYLWCMRSGIPAIPRVGTGSDSSASGFVSGGGGTGIGPGWATL